MGEGLEERIRGLEVAAGSVACVWLGQAGYLFKSPAGQIVMIDPYLSEYALSQWNMKRIVAPAIDPSKLAPDLLLASHWHEDHMDKPVIEHWARQSPGVFVGPNACLVRARAWGWPAERVARLERGESRSFGDVRVTATFARHDIIESPALDAVGFLLEIGGVKLWDVADSEYDARLRPLREERIDVGFFCINGVGGNMTAHEAALLAWHVQPRIAIPMHYNMWEPETFGPGATLDPQTFVETYRRLGGTGETRVLEVGEIFVFKATPTP